MAHNFVVFYLLFKNIGSPIFGRNPNIYTRSTKNTHNILVAQKIFGRSPNIGRPIFTPNKSKIMADIYTTYTVYIYEYWHDIY
jgi:hypothetical protein